MDPEVAAELHKLDAADQKLARQHMLQVMLQDRFKFAGHTEPHEVKGLYLVIGKNGPKLKETTVDANDQTRPSRGMSVRSPSAGVVEWDGHAKKITSMLGQLGYETGRVVFDKTGLTGLYDFTLKFAEERAFQASGPDINNVPELGGALEEQLGLKLVSGKANMDYVVIDHVERPSSN
jgi:uncharacterized protein (TIGR03435 family)